jgi:hypothetical protein
MDMAARNGFLECKGHHAPDAVARWLTMALAVWACNVAVAQDHQWTFAEIDSASSTPAAPEMALMPDGTVHVAYFSGAALKYAVRSPQGQWSFSTPVANATPGRRLSLAVDPQGNPRIAWETQWSPYNPPVRYIEYVNGAWSSVMTVGDGEEPCIALDSAGTVHLIYSNYYTATFYKTHVPGTGAWQTGPALPISFSWWPTIKINAATDNAVVFCNPTDGYYFELSGGSWSSCFVTSDPGPGYGVDPHALALEPATGQPHVVWFDAAANMKYAKRTSLPCTWKTEPLGAMGFPQAIAHTSAGDVLVLYTSYPGSAPYDLKLARRDFATGQWTHSVVASGAVDTTVPTGEMVLDSEGNPKIVFSMKVGLQWKPVLAELTPLSPCYDFAWTMGSEGSGDGQFGSDLSPRGMVVAGNTLYVCDYGNGRVQWFDAATGNYVGQVSMSYPTDIDYDAVRQRFYVRNPGGVMAFDKNFRLLWSTAIPTEYWVHYGLCVDSRGYIHTPSSYYPTTYILDPNGRIVSQYATDGGGSAAIESNCGFIYIATGGSGVKKYTEDGAYVARVVPPLERPVFLQRLTACKMAVLLESGQEVAIFDAAWQEACRFGGRGTSDGQFEGLQGVAADATGVLYVSDAALHRVQKFTTCQLIGDLNADGRVDLSDLANLLAHYGLWGQRREDGDLTGDTYVGLDDLALLLAHYGESCD